MCIRYYAVIMIAMFILVSCSSTVETISPIPEQQRVPIEIKPFEDLTGQYKSIYPSFESLITHTSSLSMIDVIEEDDRLVDERHQVTYQNPIRLINSRDIEKANFQIDGEVELISYGPINNIDNKIAAYSFFGILGLAFSQDNDLAAYVQYRIFIKDSKGNLLERFLVSGLSSDDPNGKSRKQLMSEANLIAAYSFQSQLIQFFRKQGIDTKSQLINHFSKIYALKHALDYMNNILNLNPNDSNNER